jgi:hypothetical protein
MAYLLATTLVCPLTVLGTSLQLTSRNAQSLQTAPQSYALTLLNLSKSHEIVVQEKSFNALQLASGMVGENRPFKAPFYKNYREAFLALAGQGYLGFFKGNGVDLLYQMGRLTLKLPLLSFLGLSYQSPGLTKFISDMMVMGAIDICLQPLHNFQSRFILQNRLKEFRTYRTLYRTYEFLRWREMYQGWTAVLPQTIALNISLLAVSQGLQPLHAAVGLVAYVYAYAFSTAQRRLEVQSREHTMLPRVYLNFRYAVSKMYHEEGVWHGLFRGIICNSMAVAGRMLLVPPLAYAFSSGLAYGRYKKEGWDLV